MYRILGFNGGVYRFDEVKELVDDMGGLIITRDEFSITRGAYFISQEIHVIMLVPEESLVDVESLVQDVKGDIEVLDVEEKYENAIISLIPVYNILSKAGKWVDIETIENMVSCPCLNGVCEQLESETCSIDLLETLDNMCRMELAEERENSNRKEYRIRKD